MKSEIRNPKSEGNPKSEIRTTRFCTFVRPGKFRQVLECARCCAALALLATAASPAIPAQAAEDLQKRGEEIIQRLVEVNRYWLLGPPETVKNFAYTLNRISGTQQFQVEQPRKAPRAKTQGVSYSAMLQQIARAPKIAKVREITGESGKVRLALGFDPALRGAVGNGVEGSWNGYHSLGAAEGFVLVDAERWVPLEAQLGRLHEVFGEFVQVDKEHYVPLKVRIEVGESAYDWRFRVYEPGLWLFDDSHSGERRLAWLENLTVNGAPAKVEHVTESSVALEQNLKTGNLRLEEFLRANRHWLLPSLEARRGLVYEYRQEEPYLERISVDGTGNILARLEATKEKPDSTSRQSLWLADGWSYAGDASDRFISLKPTDPDSKAQDWIQRDRLPQHLAMGLALDCALTRLAREPDQFWAEVRTAPEQPGHYLLVLHPKGRARLFTGTMLAFSSWCYMHDIDYDRSEVICDGATHRPLEEKDYAGPELKGDYVFEKWISEEERAVESKSSPLAAPGIIKAVVPHQKDGKDQSLEMTAQFGFVKPGVWLLNKVESSFRGSNDGSTGTVKVLAGDAVVCPEIDSLLRLAKGTETLLSGIREASQGEVSADVPGAHWTSLYLRPSWTEQARQSARDYDKKEAGLPLLGVYRARISLNTNSTAELEFEGLSTANWKEFRTAFKAQLKDERGVEVAALSTNLNIRAESGPTPFIVRLPLEGSPTPAKRLLLSATVERLSGAYHGHGLWMTFAEKQ